MRDRAQPVRSPLVGVIVRPGLYRFTANSMTHIPAPCNRWGPPSSPFRITPAYGRVKLVFYHYAENGREFAWVNGNDVGTHGYNPKTRRSGCSGMEPFADEPSVARQ